MSVKLKLGPTVRFGRDKNFWLLAKESFLYYVLGSFIIYLTNIISAYLLGTLFLPFTHPFY